MKTKIYVKSIAVLIALGLFTSCTDLFKGNDLQKNPNSPTLSQVDITPLTTGALVGLGTLHEDTDTRIAYMWGGQLLGQSRQHKGFQDYIVAASTFDWGNYYNTGQNIRIVQQRATAVGNKLHLGAAQVMEALLFTKLISLYGDVPYSEAFDVVNHPKPKYDGQISIYNSLIALLTDAYTNLNSGVGSITGDFMYGGDETKWAAAAKTLQARLYLHLKQYANAATAAGLGIGSGSGDLLMPHGSTYQVDMNLNFSFFDTDRPGDCSFDDPAYLPIFMTTDLASGVRTVDVAQRNSKTDETGMYWQFFVYGYETGGRDPNVDSDDNATGFFFANASQPILTFYENQLILAEALARQSASAGDANALASIAALNTVRQSLATGYIAGQNTALGTLVYTNYTAADFASGGAVNPVAKGWTDQEALLTEIASEKFITLISQYEVFNELRRLQVATPVISLGIPISFGTKYPARYIYPQNEINTNPNTPSPAPDQFQKLPVFQ